VTNTSTLDESLNDISVVGNQVRVVWAVNEDPISTLDYNVYAYTFTLAAVAGDNCHGKKGHGHHEGDGCIRGHHGHFPGDRCGGRTGDGFHHDDDGDFIGDVRHLSFFGFFKKR
jgi:hypothetical protein